MATVSSVNSLKIAIALAERQVQRDQSQVQQDAAQLDQSQAQLVRDQSQLSAVNNQSKATQATSARAAPPLSSAVATEAGKAPAVKLVDAQVNSQGETIGRFINTTA